MTRFGASHSTAILQRINANQQFTGVISTGAQSITHHGTVYEFAAANVGGLFYWETAEPIMVDQINIDLGAAGDVTINLVNLDSNNAPIAGESWLLHSATNTRYVSLDETNFKKTVLPKQAIQIISSGSAAAKIAQVVGMIERAYTH